MVTYCPYCMCPVLPGHPCPNCSKEPASYHPSSHHFPTGQLLKDRYLVGRVLGEGGFGITYLGLDTTLERRVAVKEYFPNVFVHRETSVSLEVTCYEGEKRSLYEKGRDQFLQEARVMARFDHLPEITQVLDFFPANSTAYIVMELLSGSTLSTLLNQQERIPAKYLFSMLEPVLRALNTVHGAGIIHRDISPDNIMLLDSGQLKLMDFGCARDIDKEHTMTVMLKHGYAPSEQYTGYNQGPWTDVYALCATCYHCLTGRTPPQAMERMTAQDPLIPPNRLGAALTPEQEQALLRGLAVEPKKRWQSISDLYAALYGVALPNFPWNPECIDVPAENVPELQSKAGPQLNTETNPHLELRTEPILKLESESRTEPETEPKAEATPSPEPEPELEHGSEKETTLKPGQNRKYLWIGAAVCLAVILAVAGIFALLGQNNKSEVPPTIDNSDLDDTATVVDSTPFESSFAATISAGSNHTVRAKPDGTVTCIGNNSFGQCDVEAWTDIIAVAAGMTHTVGLKSDGTMVATGFDSDGQCNVKNWSDIAAIAAGGRHTVGARSDGTAAADGENDYGQCDVGAWTDIVAVAAGMAHTVGLRSDGTVVAVGENEIVSYSSEGGGTLFSVGDNNDGPCDVGDWTDIVAVAAGYSHTVGLKSDGTVLATGIYFLGQCDVEDWTDIAAVAAGNGYTVGLRSDGTVVAVGDNSYGQCNVENWTDIVAVATGSNHTVGLKSDGTLIAVGENYYGQCDVEGWTDIMTGQPSLDNVPSDVSTPDESEVETFPVVFETDFDDYYFYPRLTQGQSDKIYNLSADELPREIADLSSLQRNQIWDDLLVPLAGDEYADVTLYGVVNAGWLSEVTAQGDEECGNISNMDENMVILRYEDKIITQDMSWNKNAWNRENPWIAVDDFDEDGAKEIAVCTYAISGMGAGYEQLWIYDPDDDKSHLHNFSDLDLMVEADWGSGQVTLTGGKYSAATTIDGYTSGDEKMYLSYGNIISFSYDEHSWGESKLEFSTAVVWGGPGGFLCADIYAPVIYADGEYKLGDVSRISLYDD